MIDETTGEVLTDGKEPEGNAPEEILQPTYRRSEHIDQLFAALSKAQAQFANAEKVGENPHFRSRYATLEAVLDATKDGRAANALAVIQMPVNLDREIGVTTLLGHSSGQWIESTLSVLPVKYDAQGAGSVITYLRRYALMAILGIAAEDDDGEAASGRPAQAQPQPAQRPQAPLNPDTLTTKDQRNLLWRTVQSAWRVDQEKDEARREARKEQAADWLTNQRMQFNPPLLRKEDMTIGQLRIITEKIQEFARSEGPQDEPFAENGSDELADSFDAEQEVRDTGKHHPGSKKKKEK